ncbi:MAG: GTPase ObgE [Chloroflexi bacterium]|nr:GTPase ObgE [Chloroflexota bacterium]
MFVDEVTIYVRSGKGGNGMVHFHREKYVSRGGPDGGDGGNGGDVYLEVKPTLNTLYSFRNTRRFIAEDGRNGGPDKMTGRNGKDLVIPVPPGTLVYSADTNELLGDLVEPGQRLLVAKGGRGGRGNQHFATASRQAPRIAEKGEPAEEKNLRLELKLIADVGLVGMPNAGKSSLLAAVSNAKPKIADYPFTTLEPNLGVVNLDLDTTIVLADIPGLVEGAHMGIGLGDAFLRHIQRTRVLIHLLDGLAEDPIADFSQINSELALFDPELGRKPQVVAFNKMDMPEAQERWKSVQVELKKHGYQAFPISALTRDNLQPLLWKAYELLQTAPEPEPAAREIPVYRADTDPRAFTIERTDDGGYRVKGESIERAASMTYWEEYAAVRRFHRLIESLGIDKALRNAGIREGDTVYIGEYELEWQD